MSTAYFASPRPLVFGHRGAAGEAPENTLPSFERAVDCGADVLELDVHATSDGIVAVIHDAELERTTDGAGPIRERRWDEVQRLDAGYRFTANGTDFPFRGRQTRVPSLRDLLERFPDALFNIEVKQEQPAIAAAVVRALLDAGCAERVLLAAEHDAIMAQIRAAGGARFATGFAAGEVAEFFRRLQSGELEGYRPPGRALQIPPEFGGLQLVTAASVGAAHAHGVEMHVWTINDPAEMDRLLDLGIDGIMSDLPGLARAAVDARRGRGE